MLTVSVIVPCYNEQATIHLLLEALYDQSYPRHEMEVIIADGLSTDETRKQINNFQEKHKDLAIMIVDNPQRTIPAGLNQALKVAKGEYVIRMDAHSLPYPDYIQKCVSDLTRKLGDNVGGVWEIRPGGAGWQARSISLAASHPLGVGDARYRYTDKAGAVDTVPFGAYRREFIQRIGRYNEKLLTNEDYELNTRIRQNGGVIWLDPEIRSVYFARRTIAALCRQYWRYGFWKARMLKNYPETLRWRQVLPPLFILFLLGLAILSIWFYPARLLLILTICLYFIILTLAGLGMVYRKHDLALMIGIPLAMASMHMTWGSGFLWSLITSPWRSHE